MSKNNDSNPIVSGLGFLVLGFLAFLAVTYMFEGEFGVKLIFWKINHMVGN